MRAALALAGLLAAGCASLPPPALTAFTAPEDTDCLRWMQALDAEVSAAGVRDAAHDPVPGFPMLRVDRTAAAQVPAPQAPASAFAGWVEHLRVLDESARGVEIANLSSAGVPAAQRAAHEARLPACSRRLAAAVRDDATAHAALRERARVPDRYSSAARAAGLYPLTRLPFFAGVQGWQTDHQAAMQAAARQPLPARALVPQARAALPSATLQVPPGAAALDAAEAERLLALHAPRFLVERRGAFDDPGAPAWAADGTPRVDTARPVVYQRVAHTQVQGRLLTQLVYTLWFPERPRTGALDLLGGALDGVIVRLTLGADGQPRLLDTIHACGCYHLFFPAPGVTLRPGAPADEEWAFVPAPLPRPGPGERLSVRIASATHYVLGVGVAPAGDSAADAVAYERRPEDDLQRLPWPSGGTRSLYGPSGLVAGTERGERFLFWPMGIASAGAMRQWGHHATAFVGRRHFDDADLLDRRFTGLVD